MEAKDTVMSDEQLEEEIRKDYKDFRVRDETGYNQDILIWAREAQAEISFKAGQEQATEDNYYRGYALGKRAGIRKVVEWIEKHSNIEASMTGSWFVMPDGSWQAFKKEKGL